MMSQLYILIIPQEISEQQMNVVRDTLSKITVVKNEKVGKTEQEPQESSPAIADEIVEEKVQESFFTEEELKEASLDDICSKCSKEVDGWRKFWCQKHPEKYGDKIVCISCEAIVT